MLGLQIGSASRRFYEVFWLTSGAVWSFGLAVCLACKLVVQAVQSWSSALLRACTGWGSPLGGLTAFYVVHWLSSGAVWSFGLAVCLACRLEVQAVQSWSSALLRACAGWGSPPWQPQVLPRCVWVVGCVCVCVVCVCVVCGRPDTSGCRGSCWVLMCLRACHPAVAPVACEVWGLDRAGCCRVVLVCVCVAFGANTDGESHKCGTAADSRGEVR